MKKLLFLYSLLVLIIFTSTAKAKQIMLSCEPHDKKNKPVSVILDDEKEKVMYNGMDYNKELHGLLYSKEHIFFTRGKSFTVGIDRITGVLEEVWVEGPISKLFKCKKINKTVF